MVGVVGGGGGRWECEGGGVARVGVGWRWVAARV